MGGRICPLPSYRWQALLRLWDLGSHLCTRLAAFLCKPAIWTMAPPDYVSPWPCRLPHQCNSLNASGTCLAWGTGHEREVMGPAFVVTRTNASHHYSLDFNLLFFYRFQRDGYGHGTHQSSRDSQQQSPPHIPIPPLNRQGQTPAHWMEDITITHFPPAELAVGSTFKWFSSSYFKRHTLLISL